MPIENNLRNTLRLTITSCRRLLEEDYRLQLEGHYGIRADGEMEPLSGLQHLNARGKAERRSIEAALRHEKIQEKELSLAIERFVRESAFTALNRLAALKLMEHPARGLVVESIGQKELSKGFRQFVMISPEALRDKPDGGYRFYLELMLDDLGQALGALFDCSLPQSIFFPSPTCLSQVLDLLNQPELAQVWGDDETIGWIYQYFTPPELRDQVRKESSAPRNGNELAFRNQFYTPRYVVEFLVDNTLGRTWVEMRQGNTSLVEQCQYLIRPPEEVFLHRMATQGIEGADGWHLETANLLLNGVEENWPPYEADQESRSRLIQLAAVVDGYQRHPKPDDWDRWSLVQMHRQIHQRPDLESLRLQDILDVMFFIYRSDYWEGGEFLDNPRELALLVRLGNEVRRRVLNSRQDGTDEATHRPAPVFTPFREKQNPRSLRVLDPACGSGHFLLYAFDLLETIYLEAYEDPDLGPPLQQEFRDLASYRQAIPGLILKHNLHGIDIDLRAAQIAALALWLRAQRSFTALRIPARQRPKALQPQIVCAEPMPGEYDLLGEFLRDLQPAILGNLVREIWERMEGADEIGSLLKIEQEIRSAIQKARKAWLSMPEGVQLSLFGDRPAAVQLKMDLVEIKDEAFWDHVEEDVLESLEKYARWASEVDGVTRQLFAHDAVQGFAFINLLIRPFDVVLMNPPFGAPSLGSKDYIVKNYPRTKNDLYAAFVERGLELLRPGGMLGAITSRTGFFLKSFQQWREEILLKECRLVAMADLGYGVLDTAMVETAAYVLHKASEMH